MSGANVTLIFCHCMGGETGNEAIRILTSYSTSPSLLLLVWQSQNECASVSSDLKLVYRARPISLASWKLELGHREKLPTPSSEQEKWV